jgi:hypothetical protein
MILQTSKFLRKHACACLIFTYFDESKLGTYIIGFLSLQIAGSKDETFLSCQFNTAILNTCLFLAVWLPYVRIPPS